MLMPKSRNVFVLCTGRNGSLGFARACGHFTNFTAGHETRLRQLGDERLRYPVNHIEVDNRLAWFLGRLEEKYGDEAVYVFLRRDAEQVAESYNKRWDYWGGIVSAYASGIVMASELGLDVSRDMVRTVEENIALFLKNKSRVFNIEIEKISTQFPQFANAIGAKCEISAALQEFNERHNPSLSTGERRPNGRETSSIEVLAGVHALVREVRARERKARHELDESKKHLKYMWDVVTESESEIGLVHSALRDEGAHFESNPAGLGKAIAKLVRDEKEKNQRLVAKLSEAEKQVKQAQLAGSKAGYAKAKLEITKSKDYQYGKLVKRAFQKPIRFAVLPYKLWKVGQSAVLPVPLITKAPVALDNPKDIKYLAPNALKLLKHQGLDSAKKFLLQFPDSANSRNLTHLLDANSARTPDSWQSHFNLWLKCCKKMPIELDNGGTRIFERIHAAPKAQITDGPLVTVIMPVYNSAATIDHAARSILNQSWANLELIIVDDCSTDTTHKVIIELSREDERVKYMANAANVGPYVSKNRALRAAKGVYVTGHDADDWAFPDRIEKQVASLKSAGRVATTSKMMRLDQDGKAVNAIAINDHSNDGICKTAFITLLFDREQFAERIGFWDCARAAADGEFSRRVAKVFGPDAIASSDDLCMLCLDHEANLTNHPVFGLDANRRLTEVRNTYRDNFQKWQDGNSPEALKLEFPHKPRRFAVPAALSVSDSELSLSDKTLFSVELVKAQRLSEQGGYFPKDIEQDLFGKEGGKRFAREHGVRVPESLALIEKIDDLLPLENYPDAIVIKPVNGFNNKGVFVLEDGMNLLDGQSYDQKAIIAKAKEDSIVGSQAFLIERLIRNFDGKPGIPHDFKFYNFGNDCAFIHVVERNGYSGKSNRHWFLKPDFTPLGIQTQRSQVHSDAAPPLPPYMEELLAQSERLSSALNMFVRVDLYAEPEGPLFGELTPFPHGGTGYTLEGNIWLGKLWDQYHAKKSG